MERSALTLIVVFGFTLLGVNCFADKTTLKPISPWSYQKMLHVGVDVDWCKTREGRHFIQQAFQKKINVPLLFKKRGFAHVRIRVKDDVTQDKSLLKELKKCVDASLKAKLIPIIAYQGAAFKDNPTSDKELKHVVKWWRLVAKTFKGYPYTLSYDLIIETTKKVKKHNDRLNELYKRVTHEIHKIDPKRIVIIAPNKISNPYELDKLTIPKPADYIMVEWHFYAAGPQKHNYKKQWTTGTKRERKLITDKISYAYQWSKKHNIPTWVGAWMSNNYNKVNRKATYYDGAPGGGEYTIQEQKVFAQFVVESLNEKNIPYAVNSDSKFFNRETNQWYKSISEVLDIILQKRK